MQERNTGGRTRVIDREPTITGGNQITQTPVERIRELRIASRVLSLFTGTALGIGVRSVVRESLIYSGVGGWFLVAGSGFLSGGLISSATEYALRRKEVTPIYNEPEFTEIPWQIYAAEQVTKFGRERVNLTQIEVDSVQNNGFIRLQAQETVLNKMKRNIRNEWYILNEVKTPVSRAFLRGAALGTAGALAGGLLYELYKNIPWENLRFSLGLPKPPALQPPPISPDQPPPITPEPPPEPQPLPPAPPEPPRPPIPAPPAIPSPDLSKLPETVILEPGSNLWNEVIEAHRNAGINLTPPEILSATKRAAFFSRVDVDEWGIEGKFPSRALPPGFVIRLK